MGQDSRDGSAVPAVRFGAFVVFAGLWSVLVYAPLAQWIFSPSGWMVRFGVLDFAGGLVVEVNCGAAGLAVALVAGHRLGWPREAMPPHNLPLTMFGAVAGLVAITPACGFLEAGPSLLLGLIAGGCAFFAVQLKHRLSYDDALAARRRCDAARPTPGRCPCCDGFLLHFLLADREGRRPGHAVAGQRERGAGGSRPGAARRDRL